MLKEAVLARDSETAADHAFVTALVQALKVQIGPPEAPRDDEQEAEGGDHAGRSEHRPGAGVEWAADWRVHQLQRQRGAGYFGSCRWTCREHPVDDGALAVAT